MLNIIKLIKLAYSEKILMKTKLICIYGALACRSSLKLNYINNEVHNHSCKD